MIVLQADFDSDLFERTTVARFLGHVGTVLDAMIQNPAHAVLKLPILSQAERRQLLVEWNQTQADAPPHETLHRWFEAQAERTPTAEAVRYEEHSLSYLALNQRANQLAHHLRRLGVGADVLVGLFLERSLDMVVAILAVLKAGGAYVPIDPEYPSDRVEYMIRDAALPVLLVQSQLAALLPAFSGAMVRLDRDHDQIVKESTANLLPTVDPDDLAYMIYTSGSTGKPKGAMNSHRGICNRLMWMQKQYGMTEADAVLQKTPFSFDVSVWEFFWPLLVGARLVVAKPGGHRDPSYLMDVIAQERVTIMHFVPSMLGAFLTTPGLERCRSLQHVMCSGEALPFNLQEEFFSLLPAQLHNLYGPTEAAVDVTYWMCRPQDDRKIVPIGRPVANTQIYILDRYLEPVPIGVPGDLYIGGVQVGRGYHNRPELTAERFVPDHLGERAGSRLYKTGDLARFLPGGEIEYLGRSDHQVKIRGFRIELGEIEAALCQHPAIHEAVVVAREDMPGVKRLVAYLVTSLSERDAETICEHLKASLPEFMVPAAFMFLDRLPLSPNGKIDRKALPIPAKAQDLTNSYMAPRTVIERKLAEIWSRVLRVKHVGVHDNFFELGGDSILSIQAIASARREGLKITPMVLFANPTIAQLASVASIADDESAIEDIAAGDVPLTPIQRWFLGQNLESPHHFNQAFCFEVIGRLDHDLVQSVLKELSQHHDALRLRYSGGQQDWRQYYAATDESPVLRWIDLSHVESDRRKQEIESIATATQASLDLEHGPIWRVVYFQAGEGETDHLLIVVHHLAVDGVSWRPLLEDFELAYKQLSAGQKIQLPAKTVSYKAWAQRLFDASRSALWEKELPYWQAIIDPKMSGDSCQVLALSGPGNREESAKTLTVTLSTEETEALLKQVPPVYNTQINDVLLTALVRAWARWNGTPTLFADLEGHGRENVLGDLDLSRTVGWFTSIFPIRLEWQETGTDWQPGEALKSIKEQVRSIPQRGMGYGILRYLRTDTTLTAGLDARLVFNYFGQLDQALAGSTMFRFGKESSGPWHSPLQRRRYVLEANSMVIDGRFEIGWTYSESLHRESEIAKLADEYVCALKQLIAHCQSPQAGGRTPSDFSLARLDQSSLDRMLLEQRDLENVYPLSPIQTLFFSANQGDAHTAFDQWHCTLNGPLDVPAFQRAWQETVRRHSVLRSTIHGEGLREPMQIVHRDVELPWTMLDWRGKIDSTLQDRWHAFLKQDMARPLSLAKAPAMRFALVQVDEKQWKFVWSVPALLLDGWSWPLVFRDASRMYEAFEGGRFPQFEAVRPYSDYLEWLNGQSQDAALAFWHKTLEGFREPIVLRTEETQQSVGEDRYAEYAVEISSESTETLLSTARRLQVTLNVLVEGVWAILLSHESGKNDVVFGASFSARPTDLAGVESIVGPFVNNLPVRVAVSPDVTTGEFLRQLHGSLLQLNPYQFTPLVEIQQASEVPWRYRLFESLVVFQNYLVDESARRFGGHVSVSDFSGPIHTNYPVLLLAEPGTQLRLTLVCDRRFIGRSAWERWGQGLVRLLDGLPAMLEQRVADLQTLLPPVPGIGVGGKQKLRAGMEHVIPPQSEMERTIASVWQQLFGVEQISVEDNFFDLGGHSMLLVQMHGRLREVLKLEFPIVTLLQHPSIRSLAGCLEKPIDSGAHDGERIRDRAKKQKEALDRSRVMARKR